MRHSIRRTSYLVGVALVFVAVVPGESRADLFGFTAISENSGVQGAVAQQLSVEVTPYDTAQVLFTFGNYFVDPYNTGTAVESAIGGVFFEDGALLGIAAVINTPGAVEFSTAVNPPSKKLPDSGDLAPPFYTSAGFWATSDTSGLGVGPTESLGIVFNLEGGYGFADVIAAINGGFEQPNASLSPDYVSSLPPTLRIGVHVGSIGGNDGDSDSFIMVPAPGAMLLGSMGLSLASCCLRRRKNGIES